MAAEEKLTEIPRGKNGFLGFPINTDLNNIDAHIAVLGVPYGLPYTPDDLSNDQSRTPDLLRENAQDAGWSEPRTIKHFDWDLGGPILDNRNVRVVDCGNVTADFKNPREHYRRAEVCAKKIFQSGAVLITIGGGLFQLPIGYFSDRSDRRIIIIFCTFFSAIFAGLLIVASGMSLENMYLATSVGVDKIMFFTYAILYGGMALPIFSLTLAYVNDYIPREKFVAAGAGMQLIFGVGAMFGPIFCTLLMTKFGTNGFFIHLLIFHLIIGFFGMYRITKRPYQDNPESTFTPLPRNITPLGIELDPTTGADISSSNK